MTQLQRLDCFACALRVEGVRALQPTLQANRTLRELNLSDCGLEDEGIRVIADSLVGNTTMQVLNISNNLITSNGMDDIARILESRRLKTINLVVNNGVFVNEASTQRFARSLSRHEFLKELCLAGCGLGDKVIRIIVDGLVGNTILEVLDISWNVITSVGLADIAWLLESMQLKTIIFWINQGVFDDGEAIQHFVTTLQHKKSSVHELPHIRQSDFPISIGAATYASISNSLTRNQQLNRVQLLLAPPPPPPPPQQQQQNDRTSITTMMLFKIWHKAITKFAMVPNNAGASAIFKLFQARPALLEKRLKRPMAAADAAVVSKDHPPHVVNDDNRRRGVTTTGNSLEASIAIGGQKRRRM